MIASQNLVLVPGSLANTASSEIKFNVCGESQTWVRPSAKEQKQHLQQLSNRYSQDKINQLGGDYWKHNIFAFTTYPGGSGTFDINNFSGLWKKPNPVRRSTCDKSVVEINSGKIARVYILLHRVTKIQWQNNRYIMVVKPVGKGVQIINLPRKEKQNKLPLTVVDESGKQIALLMK
ncbi:hypothetical protein IJ00_05900 [Calothrix sp. 336/3]|nr:hypothetical protein [Calothrix sp. 336/3]AKG20897.1 hypothetical protein IJ00_05900 [Calothrix sp. 336/3]